MMRALPPLAFAAALFTGCATGQPARVAGPATAAPVPSGVTCPAAVDEAGWGKLAAPCRGRLALERSAVEAAARNWNAALRWARAAREHLEPSLRGLAAFREGEALYALGMTASAAPFLAEALPAYHGTATEGEIHYYLGELALARNDRLGAFAEFAAALRLGGNAAWRPAAESLLTESVLSSSDGESLSTDKLPAELQPLVQYLEGETQMRRGRYVEAARIFAGLKDNSEILRLGLSERVATRLDELGSRGTAEPGKYGIVLPFTGRAAPFGIYTLRGFLLGADPFANAGLSLLIENDRGEPFRSVQGVRSAAKRGAIAVAGLLTGRSAEAGLESAVAIGLPAVILSSTPLPRLAPWGVRMAVTPAHQIRALLDEAIDKRGYRRFAILHPNDAFGLSMRDDFWDAAVARGAQITGVESYEPGSTDFKRPIRALVGADEFTAEEVKQRKAANQPLAHLDFDAVFIPDGGRTVGLILPQLLYFDVRGPVFMGPSTWNDPRLIEMGREYTEGTLFVDWYWAGAQTPETEKLLAAYESAYGEGRPPSVTAQGYEAGKMLAAAKEFNSREAVRDAFYGYAWQSFSGRAKVGADGEIERPLTYLTVEGKQIVPINRTGF